MTGHVDDASVKQRAAGRSDVGRQRDVNEDRVHVDLARGIFVVVDGVGGQAAGGRAADTAIDVLRARLERQQGAPSDRVRDAITEANNEINRLASQRPEWRGMACVVTVVVLERGRATIGHVGDTRLYAVRADAIEKITPDHSPVGEREDAREISEIEAMRHPRRNEVYRDVGSEPHQASDPNFIWVHEIDVAAGTSLLLCSDGLSDLLPSEAIRQIAVGRPGRPEQVVDDLIAAANDAGGKDNVSVVYIEDAGSLGLPRDALVSGKTRGHIGLWMLALLILAGASSVLIWRVGWTELRRLSQVVVAPRGPIVVQPGESVMAALAVAQPGQDVLVEPGEYREQVVLRNGVRLVSRVPGGATLRLPVGAAEGEAAVVALDVTDSEVVGFRIVGDAATPLGIGLMVRASRVRLVDIEVSGASAAAIDITGLSDVTLMASRIRDNPGAALVAGPGASVRIAHSTFARNHTTADLTPVFDFDTATPPTWTANVFVDVAPASIAGDDAAAQKALEAGNWFVSSRPAPPPVPGAGRASRGR